jgi:hypothetical protein
MIHLKRNREIAEPLREEGLKIVWATSVTTC